MEIIKSTLFISKSITILLIIIFSNTEHLKASHLLGADLTYRYQGPNQYLVQLSLYRDCAGVALSSTANINYTGTSTSNFTLQRTTVTDITPTAFTSVSSCNGNTGIYGIEEHIYTGVLTLPPNSVVDISYSSCCRNNAITTLSSPGTSGMYIESRINSQVSNNNSPEFLNEPSVFSCINSPVFFNHGAVDADGDSLSFSLANCKDNVGVSVSYSTGYSATNPLGFNPVNINSTTGTITFTPTALHVAIICVLVEEYRNGVLIGSVTRDIQFNIINCTNANPQLSDIQDSVANTSDFSTTVNLGSEICFDVYGIDSINPTDAVMMYASNMMSGAFFYAHVTSGNERRGNFCWTPLPSDKGNHLFYVNMTDFAYPLKGISRIGYRIRVVDSLTVNIADNANSTATATPQGGTAPYSFLWDSTANNQTTATASGLSSGNYTVRVSDYHGYSTTQSVSIIGLSYENLNLKRFNLYPNPARSSVFIDIKLIEKEDLSIQLINTLGEIIKENTYGMINSEHIEIDTKNLVSGMYTVHLTMGNNSVSKKLIIE